MNTHNFFQELEEAERERECSEVDELEALVQRAQQILVVLEGRGRTVQWTKDSLADISNDIEELKQGLR